MPTLACEAVLAKATYLTRQMPGARAAPIEMIGEGFLSIGIAAADHHSALPGMVKRRARGYRNPNNFANMIYFLCGKLAMPYPRYFTLDPKSASSPIK